MRHFIHWCRAYFVEVRDQLRICFRDHGSHRLAHYCFHSEYSYNYTTKDLFARVNGNYNKEAGSATPSWGPPARFGEALATLLDSTLLDLDNCYSCVPLVYRKDEEDYDALPKQL